MGKYGFEPAFPKTVIQEVSGIHERTFTDAPGDVKDLRGLLWSSIDNADSMDLDQLEYCERAPGGEIQVRVAIADVDSYVPKKLADRQACGTKRDLGVYGDRDLPHAPGQALPGNNIASPRSRPDGVIIEYAVLPDGSIRPGDLYKALVLNKAKLIYEVIGDWLEGKSPLPAAVSGVPGLEQQLRLQNDASKILRRHRREEGALELNTIEANPVVEGDEVRDLVVQRQNLARCLIEEFMVAANGTMVAFLGKNNIPMIQRVVRTPQVLGGDRCGRRFPWREAPPGT